MVMPFLISAAEVARERREMSVAKQSIAEINLFIGLSPLWGTFILSY
jgi:hypothetical protein